MMIKKFQQKLAITSPGPLVVLMDFNDIIRQDQCKISIFRW